MYQTLVEDVKGEIEEKVITDNENVIVKGWAFSEKMGVCPLRCKYDGTIKIVDYIAREDLCNKFQRNSIVLCGWKCQVPKNKYIDAQIKIAGEWTTYLSFNTFNADQTTALPSDVQTLDSFINQAIDESKPTFSPQATMSISSIPTPVHSVRPVQVHIIDNFYEDPDTMRKLAINSSKIDSSLINSLSPLFENIIGSKLNVKCKFEFTTAKDSVLINTESHQYFGIIFLTPNAPINTGVTLYRSKNTGKMTTDNSDKNIVFRNGQQDTTEFEPVDIIGNVYNRLVIFNSRLIHSISHNFGKDIHNGRLVQTFAFDLDHPATTKISLNM
jgi:hypothetical protein